MKRKTFWMVLGSGVPTYRHNSREAADGEAVRLAQVNPGFEFHVLESKGTAAMPPRPSLTFEEHQPPPKGEEIPF